MFKNGFLTYLLSVSIRFAPMNIQFTKTSAENEPAKAPFEFANGMKIPSMNNPRIGPPMQLFD